MSFKIKVDTSGLDFDLANITVKLNCPECQALNTIALAQVRREEVITCVGCHKTIRLVDKNKSVAKAVSNFNDALDDLRRKLEHLGR